MSTNNLTDKAKRLIVVGNGAIINDYSDLIDSADIVIRFNNLNNYGQATGKRMTHWVLSSNKFLLEKQINSPGGNLENGELSVQEMIKICKQLLFSIPPIRPMTNNNKAAYQRVVRDDTEERIQAVNRFLEHFDALEHDHRLLTFPAKYIVSLADHLWPPNWTCPSNGYLVARLFLDDLTYYYYEKYMVGFTWEGWDGHPWMLEKMYVEKLARDGFIKLLK